MYAGRQTHSARTVGHKPSQPQRQPGKSKAPASDQQTHFGQPESDEAQASKCSPSAAATAAAADAQADHSHLNQHQLANRLHRPQHQIRAPPFCPCSKARWTKGGRREVTVNPLGQLQNYPCHLCMQQAPAQQAKQAHPLTQKVATAQPIRMCQDCNMHAFAELLFCNLGKQNLSLQQCYGARY